MAKRLLGAAVKSAASALVCPCQQALEHAILTAPDAIPAAVRRKLALLTNRVFPSSKGKR
jgi:hypothetical protein